MGLKDIPFKPGVVADLPDREVGTAGFWKDADKVRFLNGLPQTMGGWVKDAVLAAILGTARGGVDWQTTRGERVIGVGTNVKLYVWIGGVFSDITPIRTSHTINNNPFSMTDTLTTVTVTDTAHGAVNGDYVTFSGATAAGGITIVGEYAITYIDANSYTITHSAAATSTTSGGGAGVVAVYQINVGGVNSEAGLGWGSGAWSGSTWGTSRTVTDIVLYARTWKLDVWGEDLIASHFDGSIYVWDSSAGVGTRATLIAAAPTSNKAIFVSQESRHIVALGASADPLSIKWCDSETYTDWTPTTTNSAGDARVDQGSQLLTSVALRDQHLVFTDSAIYAMQYVGPPYTFSVKPQGLSGGLAGPNAAIAYMGLCYWMGDKNFYYFDGVAHVLDCPVFEKVFNDYNVDEGFKVWAGVSVKFDEVWWLYCTEDSTEIDRYVVYSTVEKHWTVGTLARTMYIGDSDVIPDVYAFSADGYLYYHEIGTSDNGAALTSYVTSGDFEIAEGGEQLMHVSKLIPDFKRLVGAVDVLVTTKKYPQAAETQTSATLAVTSATEFISPRVRGRQASIKLASTSTTADWRAGPMRLDLKPHGKR